MNNEYHTVSRTLSYWHSRWRNTQNDRNATSFNSRLQTSPEIRSRLFLISLHLPNSLLGKVDIDFLPYISNTHPWEMYFFRWNRQNSIRNTFQRM